MTEAKNPRSHRLGVHLGQILYDRLANIYPSLLLTVVETIQNAIDADATQVLVAIDQQASRVVVVDNGDGVTVSKFALALDNVGQTQKRRGQLGRFGVGLISPLNKCKLYNFYSRPKGQDTVNHWTFEGAAIRTQKNPSIPHEEVSDLPEIPSPFKTASRRLKTVWNTMVLLEDTTQDRTIRNVELDELEHQILIKLSNGMRKKGTKVHVVINDEHGRMSSREIVPMRYTGEPLEEVVYEDADCGRVVFKLYRASKTRDGRKGEVVVMQMDDNYPISWKEYRDQAWGSGYLVEFLEAFSVLGSGYFEGVVLMENVQLDVARTRFVMDDALRTSYFVIDRWFREHGQRHYEDEQESRREERYRELGEKSLNRLLEQIAADPKLHGVLEDLLGSAPASEAKAPKQRSGSKRSGSRRRIVVEPRDTTPQAESGEHTNHRRRAHGQLRFEYDQIHGYSHVWQFDHDATTIIFNTLHPDWVSLDESADGKHTARHDRQIVHLQLYLGLEVIQLLAEYPDPDEFEAHRHEIDKRIRPYSALLIQQPR